MSRADLTPFSYVVMTLVGAGGAGPHDLVRMARQGRVYWSAGESQYYVEPKRLARLGYLDLRKGPGKTRERTHYTLTEKGLEALRTWAVEPTSFPRMQQEGALRLMAADLVGEAAVRGSIGALRSELTELAERLETAEAAAEALPHRRKYLLLNHRLSRKLIQAHREWVDEVERELDGGS